MESNLKVYKYYFGDENGQEISDVLQALNLDNVKEILADLFDNKRIIKISEFPKAGESSIPIIVYSRDCD